MKRFLWTATPLLLAFCAIPATAKLSPEKQLELIRDLTAEMATAKVMLPRSKDSLDILANGTWDPQQWEAAYQEYGVAARAGDMVQITSVRITDKRLVLVINNGLKGGKKWWHNIEVSASGGMNGRSTADTAPTHAPGGTQLALYFDDGVPDRPAEDFKTLLQNALNFEMRTATEQYLDQIEPEFKKAIEDKEVVVGMDKDMVLLAKDRPDRKYRDFKNGVETEDWIYGTPPGDIIFVTFQDGKVINVKYQHANLGGEVQPNHPIER